MKKVLLVVMAMVLSACASVNPVAKPEVAITSIALGESTGLQQKLSLGLQLDNPNAFDINLGRLRYKVSLAGQSLAGGSFNEAVVLPANDRLNLVVPVELNLLSGIGLVSAILSKPQDQLEYVLSLTANVTNFGLGDITINKTGFVGLGSAGGSQP